MLTSYATADKFIVGSDFQREWIERRGILLLIALYLGGVGGGLFLASLISGWKAGLLVALGIVAIGKGGAHLLFLGRPLRFWRAFWKPQSSWIARGMYIIFLLIIFGLAYYLTGNAVLMGISAFFAFCLMIYTGFMMAVCPGISFWNNPLLPMVFVSAALLSGISLAEAIHSFSPQIAMNTEVLKVLGLWLGMITVLLLLAYLWVGYYAGMAAKESVLFLAAGRFSPVFYPGVVVVGIAIPLAILIPAYFVQVPLILLAVAGICELAGSFVLRYSLLKAGVYPPIA